MPKTVAESVTGAPTTDGLGVAVNIVVVMSADRTTWTSTCDVEFAKFASALVKTAVMWWVPLVRYVGGVQVAFEVPFAVLRVTFEQIGVEPSKKVTLPVGLFDPPESVTTVAV